MSYTISPNLHDGSFPQKPYFSVCVFDDAGNTMTILILEGNQVTEIRIVNPRCIVNDVIEAVMKYGKWNTENFSEITLC